jgi:hypothetical protein
MTTFSDPVSEEIYETLRTLQEQWGLSWTAIMKILILVLAYIAEHKE